MSHDPYGPSEFLDRPDEPACELCEAPHGGAAYRCQMGDLGNLRCLRRPRHRGKHCDGEKMWNTPKGGVIGAAAAAREAQKPPPPPPPSPIVAADAGPPEPLVQGIPAARCRAVDARPEKPASMACAEHVHPMNMFDHCADPTVDGSICTRQLQHDPPCCSGRVS